MGNITFLVENITPEKAKEYLDNNCINRSVSKDRVNCFADDMKNGKWQLNGEAIQFNKKGDLINGQHRLNAIIKADRTVCMLVVRNVEDDVDLFDRGRIRSVTDSFIISGMSKDIANSTFVAIAKLHHYLQTGKSYISDFEIKDFLTKHLETFEMLNEFIKCKSRGHKGMNIRNAPLLLAVMYAYECGVDKEKLKRFIDVLRTGLHNGPEEFAATTLRNDFLAEKFCIRNSTERKHAVYISEKAISDFVEGYPRKKSYTSFNYPIYSNNSKFKEG